MKTNLTMTNESFNFLRGSSDFLNTILNNITSCVLLLDKEMRLRAFNDALNTIFTSKKEEELRYQKCGEAIGCAHQIEEQKECGETTKCKSCELRIAALTSYMNNEIIEKDHIIRPFFDTNHQKVDKHLQFSTRLFLFNHEKYIIMIIEDITNLTESKARNVN